MENNDIIINELKEISAAVANLNRRNVYTVPSGYFSNLSQLILTYVKANGEDSSITNSANPFTVPQGYFDSLSSQILDKVKQPANDNEVKKELAEIAPLLNSISKINVYVAPGGYFETLEVKTQIPAKVRAIGGFSKLKRYTVAAVATGIVAVGGLFYLNKETPSGTASSFNKVDLKQLSEQEIVEYLNANSSAGASATGNFETDASLLIQTQQLSEEEIIQYLNENPEPGEAFQVEG